MTILQTFNPAYGTGQTITTSATSSVTLIGAGQKTICITDLAGVQAYVRIGGASATATMADYPVPVSGQVTLTKDQDATHIAVITPSGAGSVHVILGEGF